MATVYEIKRGEVNMYVGRDGDELLQKLKEHVAGLSKSENGDEQAEPPPVNLMPYIFYEDGKKPVPVIVQNGKPCAITFPDPEHYGATSADRYSQSSVYKDGWVKLLQLRTKGKATWTQQAKKLLVVALPLALVIFLTFIMVMSLG